MNTYRIETKDKDGIIIDYIDIETVEPLLRADDIVDELNLETNEQIKRVGQVTLDGSYPKYWHVDTSLSNETHVVAYLEDTDLLCLKNKPFTDTDRSMYSYGEGTEEYDTTTCIWTNVRIDGTSRIYVRLPKEEIGYHSTYTSDIINDYFKTKPVKVNYALRYPVVIPRSMAEGHLLTLKGQTDIELTTTSEQNKLPIMKFNVGDTQYTLDNNPIHIDNTQEGVQIRNIVLEGNTPINYARSNGVNTTEQESNTRYDFEPFYDGQATIQGTVEGGYVSAKLYGDTMVNIAKPYGESPLLTATNESALCDDLLGTNEEGIVLADGEITEGRIYGDSLVNLIGAKKDGYDSNNNYVYLIGSVNQGVYVFPLSRKIVSETTYTVYVNIPQKDTECIVGLIDGNTNNMLIQSEKGVNEGLNRVTFVATKDSTTTPYLRVIFNANSPATKNSHLSAKIFVFEGDVEFDYNKHGEFFGIGSVVNPTVLFANHPIIFGKGGRL